MNHKYLLPGLLLSGALFVGCVGVIGDPIEEALPEVDAPTLRKLTVVEFTNSVKDLLGDVVIPAVEADSLQNGFLAVGAARVAISPAGVAKYEQAMDAITKEAFADPTRVAKIFPCVPMDPADIVCSRTSIAAFGRRAFRRPLSTTELTRYTSIAEVIGKEMGDGVQGLRHAVWGVLQSPHFLYRNESGLPSPQDGGRLKFTPFQMASRLSYTLWATLPDEALLNAAEVGDLSKPEGIKTQVDRMLADPRARNGVTNFVTELYGLFRLTNKFKDVTVFPEWTPSLRTAMREDVVLRVNDLVFDAPDDFLSLYDGRKVFVNNELATIYGLPEPGGTGFSAALLPETGMRRGLVGSGAVLSMYSLPQRTSATERGQFIAEALLCKTVPPPPPEVNTNLNPPAGGGPLTLRQKLAPHRENAACAACHNLTDPPGLALENFDSIGRFRETDQGLTIDASGDLDGAPFQDGGELATRLREHPEAARCLVRKLITYTGGRTTEQHDEPHIDALEAAFSGSGRHFAELLRAVVTSDDFRFAQPQNSKLKK